MRKAARSCEPFGALLKDSGDVLGCRGGLLEASWRSLGSLLGALGSLLGALGGLLGRVGSLVGRQDSLERAILEL